MKFSVIVPAHNASKTLRKTLDSVKSQSFNDYELIVVCDACTDNTKQIALEYTNKVFEVEYHKSSASRNLGLDHARGEWVLFLDADDWYLHEFVFEMLAKKVGKEHEHCLCYAIIWRHIGYGPVRSPKGTIYGHATNKCWRRDVIGNNRFPDIERAEDDAFFKMMQDKGIKIVEWDMPLYYYNYLCAGSKSIKFGRTPERTKQYWSIR